MKKQFTLPFVVMAMMFTVFLILANLMEVKVVRIGILTATAGLSVFPVSYIINDCIVEANLFHRFFQFLFVSVIFTLI